MNVFMFNWNTALIGYLGLAILTLLPVLSAWLRGVDLKPGGAPINASPILSDQARVRLAQHYSRLEGTLRFWKKRATLFTRFHYYCTIWMILSAWAVPLIAVVSRSTQNDAAQWLLVAISSHVALALSFHRGMRVSDSMKSFRHGESEFYDLYRRILDQPDSFGSTEKVQLKSYFSAVERLRKSVRNAETENIPDVETFANQPTDSR